MKDELDMILGEIPDATSPSPSPWSAPNHFNNSSFNHNQSLDLVSELAQRMTDPSYYPCGFTHIMEDDDSLKCNYGFASSPVTVNGFPWASDYSSSGGRSHSSSPPRFESHSTNSAFYLSSKFNCIASIFLGILLAKPTLETLSNIMIKSQIGTLEDMHHLILMGMVLRTDSRLPLFQRSL